MFCSIYLHRWVQRPATLNPARIVRRCKRCGHVSVIRKMAAPEWAPPAETSGYVESRNSATTELSISGGP